jgi:hypothetical protein
MNWNDSYDDSETTAGNAGTDGDTVIENRTLRSNAKTVATQVRYLLPAEYSVTGDVTDGANGPQAFVAIQPPVGRPITADFGIEEYTDSKGAGTDIPDDERDEVAAGLAARAALQVKQAIGDGLTPTAR